ncbi:5,6-dimethylbenzimidazole synthase [Streptomyces sp. NPDC056069]|uniref:5,6-dimethylbenzimidazole synthase n=1 Tax=Streptomyces sp. NPDC056069 TaxID=3345702 RepID=UPI0035E1990B
MDIDLTRQSCVPLVATGAAAGPEEFGPGFRETLYELFRWRRDVRHFATDPIPDDAVEQCLDAACLAPSVGLSQPWRFVSVDAADNRTAVAENFTRANADALAGYSGERAKLYATLKLAGLRDAPRQLAVFCDEGTTQGAGLGQRTMPEMLRYSVVTAVFSFWLHARAHGIGVGWVSILDPVGVARQLEVPPDWKLVAYLCVGRPLDRHETPELHRVGWQQSTPVGRRVLRR